MLKGNNRDISFYERYGFIPDGAEQTLDLGGDANDPHIEGCNVIFVDPPRKDLSKELTERIGELQPDKVVYISCAADTFARDLRLFAEPGYTTDEAFPYDMFPRTAHVETVVLLSREKADDYIRISVHTKDLKQKRTDLPT